MSHSRVPRVEQLDASIWNEELYNLFLFQVKKSVQYLPSKFIVAVWPEVEAFFRYAFWDLSLRSYGGTFGQNLFGIVYKDSKWKLRLLAFSVALAPWLWTRILRNCLLHRSDLIHAVDKAEKRFNIIFKLFSLLNFCVFLRDGMYPTIYNRLLKLVPMYESKQSIREISYESANREILWHGFAEFLAFVLPLVNLHKMKNFFSKSFSSYVTEKHNKTACSKICNICDKLATFPSEIGCHHVFCYYCIMSNVLVDEHYKCSCGHSADGTSSVKAMAMNS